MTNRVVFIPALALVIAGISAPNASASCNPPKFASTYNSVTGAFSYWHTTIVGGTLQGQMWSGATDYTGTCNTPGSSFLYFGIDPQNVGLSVSLGDACVPGCPAGSISVKATVTNSQYGEFVATSTPETPAGGVNFDFSNTAHTMVPMPRPRILSVGHIGAKFLLNTFPVPLEGWSEGTDAQVTGCNFLSAASAADPGRQAAAYPTLLATAPASSGSCVAVQLSVDCVEPIDKWIVIQTVTTAGPDPLVGPATRVNCGWILAEPKTKVNRKNAGISNRRN